MSKRMLTLIICSLIVIIVWVGSAVYANIVTIPSDDTSITSNPAVLAPVNTNMHMVVLNALNAESGLIKIPNSSLEPATSATPSPTPAGTL